MRTTIKDVAKAAGVSTATVSLITNNKSVLISQETRDRVLRVIRELDYHPNRLAASLVTRKTNTIGLLIPDSTNPFMANLVHKIRLPLLQDGITVIVGDTDYDSKIMRQYIEAFVDRNVDVLIITQPDFSNRDTVVPCLQLIKQLDIPIISYGRDIYNAIDFPIPIIETDQVHVGYLATSHLLNLGHRRIGCVTGGQNLDVTQLRYEGYMKAFREYGMKPDSSLVYDGHFSIESGVEALPYLLGHNATAIFAFNDLIAYGIYKSSKAYHLSIPRDLSVVAVDDIPFSDIVDPPLTTVEQPVTDIAGNIVTAVRNVLNGNKEPTHLVLQPSLKVRGSTSLLK